MPTQPGKYEAHFFVASCANVPHLSIRLSFQKGGKGTQEVCRKRERGTQAIINKVCCVVHGGSYAVAVAASRTNRKSQLQACDLGIIKKLRRETFLNQQQQQAAPFVSCRSRTVSIVFSLACVTFVTTDAAASISSHPFPYQGGFNPLLHSSVSRLSSSFPLLREIRIQRLISKTSSALIVTC